MRSSLLLAVVGLLLASAAQARTIYVSPSSRYNGPGTKWSNAFHTIQPGIDAAVSGDTVLVTNGVYSTGGKAVYNNFTNRIAIDKPITVRSVNGPAVTTIVGRGPSGPNAIRCAYVGTNAILVGFTVTNGFTRTSGDYEKEQGGGGVWCVDSAIVSNCTLSGNSAYGGNGGGAYGGTLNHCTLSGNSASSGGGAYGGTLSNCTLSGNSASSGGGAYGGTLNNCTLSANSASEWGGGTYSSTLNHCTFSGNSASSGGGASYGTLNYCTLSGNSANYGGGGASYGTLNYCTLSGNSANYGGGADDGTLNNCTLSGNSANSGGGGARGGTLNNCTLSGNSANEYGGGAYCGTLKNCIVYYNSASAGPNHSGSSLSYCCTSPHPGGTGNITNEPKLVSFSHIATNSPSVGAGSSVYVSGTDIDGDPWLNPPAIGCDQPTPGSMTGTLSVAVSASYTNVVIDCLVDFVGSIHGRVSANAWDFGDGTERTANALCASHAFTSPGSYPVTLWAYNESHPEGVVATVTVRVVTASIHYVNANNATPLAPYISWKDAAVNIQDAIDVAGPNNIVLVTNGVYSTGGKAVYNNFTNRVAIDKPITVRSVNGPDVTTIAGQGPLGPSAIRCAYVGTNAILVGFTLTNGSTRTSGDGNKAQRGGGVYCEDSSIVSNCTLSGNSANSGGGGACNGTLNNCMVSGNSAGEYGGGASGGTLNNCILSGNSAKSGGGVYYGTLKNCTLSGNSAQWGGGAYDCTLNNCTLSANSANYGGGVFCGTLNNCALSGNSANYDGGGAYRGTLNNCTLSGNSVEREGGGTYYGALNNCIVYYNSGPTGPNHYGATVSYCCTSPDPGGTGNITNEPKLIGFSHIATNSPCVGAGSSAYASGTDIDGDPWMNPPSIGCDQPIPGSITGILTVTVSASYTNVATGFPVDLVGSIQGKVSANAWDFKDGTERALNAMYVSHAFALSGSYPVTLWAYNENHPEGVAATVTVRVVTATIHYVNASNATPVAPYLSWSDAAVSIQDAIDACVLPGDTVLVTNGIYATGGKTVNGNFLTICRNRIAIDKSITVRSVNGPDVTTIVGQGPLGPDAIRCAYVGTNATLIGFTLTSGFTRTSGDGYREQSGGGVWCEDSAIVNNCTISGNSAGYHGGGASGGTLNNCTLSANSAQWDGGGVYYGTLNNCTLSSNSAYCGGGAYYGTLNNCTLSGNSAKFGLGGGASYGTLNNCTLSANSAGDEGGGAYYGTLNNCTLSSNSANNGGGASYGTLNNCTLSSNSANNGGGAYYGTLNNCTFSANSANNGGGAYYGTLNNCTLSANSANYGGGVFCGTLNNCIVYYNSTRVTGANHYYTYLSYCCTSPDPGGTGNITQEPKLISYSHIAANSPCVGAGSSAYVSGTDIDGDPWLNPPSIGCDQPTPGSITGILTVAVSASYTNVTIGCLVDFAGSIQGKVSANAWDFGDGTERVLNTVYVSHTFTSLGSYHVTLWAYNESHPEGVVATVTVHVVTASIHYVNAVNATPLAPYLSWNNASTNIQDAIDAAISGDTVLVTNGIYATGGKAVYNNFTNRIAIDKSIIVRSVNGPDVTTIVGQGPLGPSAIRCAYVGTNAILVGFTLTNGFTRTEGDYVKERDGGGVWCEDSVIVSNCTISANSAYSGGGAFCGTLNNCTISGNSAQWEGGGVYYGTLNNCTLSGNSAGLFGGGVSYGTLNNCIVYYNSAPTEPNYSSASLSYCCTSPDPGGMGNITDEPSFMDWTSGNFLLRYGSPCIDAGTDLTAAGITTDILGTPRPLDGNWDGSLAFDMGAYEYSPQTADSSNDGIPDWWCRQYGLDPNDAGVATNNPDADPHTTFQEWIAGTDPTNALSFFEIQSLLDGPPFQVFFPSLTNRCYTLYGCTDLVHGAWSPVTGQDHLPGGAGTGSLTDTNTPTGPHFYRVGVTLP